MGRARYPRRRRRTLPAFADVYVELTLMTFRRLAPTVLLSAVGMVLTTGLIAHRSQDLGLWNLACGIALVGALRFAIVLAFERKPRENMSVAQARRWLQWYGAATYLNCICLSASTLYNLSHHNQLASTLCTIGIFSQCAGLGTRPGMRPWFKQGCSLTMLGALAIATYRTGAMLAITSEVMILFFAYSHCEAIKNQFAIVVEQLRSRRKLRELAEQDILTGLANRRHFQNALALACEQPTHPFAILYIDLDRFKTVNDTFGHLTGDILLSHVAARLKKAVRSSDLVARIGGDEFSVLQQAVVSLEDAQALATRIVADLSAAFEIEGRHIQIGASIGIRLSSHSDRDPELLLAHADTALYRVKQSGGGAFSFNHC